MSRSSTTSDRAGPAGRAVRTARAAEPVTPLAPRRYGRPAARRRPVVWAAALLVVAGLAGFLWAGPLLAVRSVRVDGATTLPAEQVREAAGVAEGTPLLQVDVEAATRRVAELPQVADVQVSRGWPATVVITVVERTPLAVVEEAGRRTLAFAGAFGAALALADEVVVMEVYGAREDPVPGVTGAMVADAVPLPAGRVAFEPSWSAAAPAMAARSRPGDLVVTMGAGDVSMVGPEVLEALRARSA